MFRKSTLLLLSMAVLLAFVAVIIVRHWVKNTLPNTLNQSIVSVVIANSDIAFASKIKAEQLKTVSWPQAYQPVNFFTDTKDVIGKISTQTIHAGDVINKGEIREQAGMSLLSALIEPNMRAITVRVNDVIGLSGFLSPNNYVDVLATTKSSANKEGSTQVVLEKVKVLAVDQILDAKLITEKDKLASAKTVTLEVAVNQAQKLVNATVEGTIQLVLRNPNDEHINKEPEQKPVEIETKTESMLNSLITPVLNPIHPPKVKPASDLLIIKGASRSVINCIENLPCGLKQENIAPVQTDKKVNTLDSAL